MHRSTKDKIIEAAVELVNEKGYAGATTKELAERAGVNEVTLFRHFGSKKGIIEAAVQKYAYVDRMETVFSEKIVWNLEQDLKMLAKEYQVLMEKKRPVILLAMKEAGSFPELDAMIQYIPQKYVELLETYFAKMVSDGKLNGIDPFTVATNFIFTNFGYFLMRTRIQTAGNELVLDDFIEKNIQLFIESLR